jgi:hypothetical protein
VTTKMRDVDDSKRFTDSKRDSESSLHDSMRPNPSQHQGSPPSALSAERPPWLQAAIDEARTIASSRLPPIQAAWGDFIRYRDWTWFFTGTFADAVHPEQANKRWTAWIRALEQSRFRTDKQQPIIWARATELQRRGVYHYHSLVAGVTGIPLMSAMILWERIAGGYGRVVAYDVQRGGAFYVVKRGEIDLSDAWFDDASRIEPR